jgi:hypothetical protein
LNLDETGSADLIDVRIEKVAVPADDPVNSIPFAVDRRTKRSTPVAGTSAGGARVKALIVLPHKTIESELRIFRYTADKTVFSYQENGFRTSA